MSLLAPASILSENIIRPLLASKFTDARFLLLTRLPVIIVSVAGLLTALSHQDILSLVAESSVIGLVTLFVPLVAALHFKNKNRHSAFLSMVLGTIVYTLFRFMPISDIHPSLFGLLGSWVGFMLGRYIRLCWTR